MNLLFDIGGTHLRAALSSNENSLGEEIVKNTPQNFNEVVSLISGIKEELVGEQTLESCVVGVAGVLNSEKSELLFSPNLPEWVNIPLKIKLAEVLGVNVSLENDAALAGLGEAIYGSGKDYKIVAYLTIGTGVGGVRIVNGKIDEKTLGFEPGHQIIDSDGTITGEMTDLEGLVAGMGLEKRFKLKPEDIKDVKAWDDVCKYLAIGINNTVLHWSPEVVVLGGGLINEGAIDIEKVKSYFYELLRTFPQKPNVIKATLGDKVGLYGALAYLKSLNLKP